MSASSHCDIAGAHAFIEETVSVLEAIGPQPFRWYSTGLCAYLLRDETGLDNEGEDREYSLRCAEILKAGHYWTKEGSVELRQSGRNVAKEMAIDAAVICEIIAESTDQVECAWNERARLGPKPSNTQEVTDENGDVIMRHLYAKPDLGYKRKGRMPVPVFNKDGSPKLVAETQPTEESGFAYSLWVEPLAYLDQARKLMGIAPESLARFNVRVTTIANLLMGRDREKLGAEEAAKHAELMQGLKELGDGPIPKQKPREEKARGMGSRRDMLANVRPWHAQRVFNMIYAGS